MSTHLPLVCIAFSRGSRVLARLAVAGCLLALAGAPATTRAQVAGPDAPAPLAAPDWPGYALGLRPASWRVLGHYDGAAPTDEELEALQARTEDTGPQDVAPEPNQEPKELAFYAFHQPTRTVYRFTVARNDAKHIGRWMERNEPANAGAPESRGGRSERLAGPEPDPGLPTRLPALLGATDPSSPSADLAGGIQQVVGTDERVRFTQTRNFPYRAIGNEGGCTGTQIGPRHVVTSAHCLAKYGTQSDPDDPNSANWYMTRYIPGRDGDTWPFGGPYQPVWYFVPASFLLGTGGALSDWGVMTLPASYKDYPTGGIGWFGMLNAPINTLKSMTARNRGYPLCDENGPLDCVVRTLWGKPEAQIVGTHEASNQILLHNSDTNKGHSGSAVFVGSFASPSVVGIHKGPSGSVNMAVRLTQDRIDYILYLRSLQK